MASKKRHRCANDCLVAKADLRIMEIRIAILEERLAKLEARLRPIERVHSMRTP